LAKILANELAAKGLNMNAVAAGYISTNTTKELRDHPERPAEIPGRIPAGHRGDPVDIAGAVTLLISTAVNRVTGAVPNVDGGWLAG